MRRNYIRRSTTPIIRLDDRKAGFDKVDKANVEALINEASKGSLFYENEQRLAALREARVREARLKCDEFHALPFVEQDALRLHAASVVAELESKRKVGVIAHLDMDAFYASVAQKLNPALRDVPFAVGNSSMLATTNYIARGFGVRAGIPGYIGKQLCPELVFTPTDFPSYVRESREFRRVVSQYDPKYFSVGLDELTFDLEPYIRQHYPSDASSHDQMLTCADAIVRDIREKIMKATELSASGGIAPTAALSKVAGNLKKPNGQHLLRASTAQDIKTILSTLPIRKFPGIGRVLEELSTQLFAAPYCGDLLKQPELLLYVLPRNTANFLIGVGLGTASAEVPEVRPFPKSISHSRTLPGVISQPVALASIAERFLQLCCASLQEQRLVGRVVSLSIKTHKFNSTTTSKAANVFSNDPKVLSPFLHSLLAPYLPQCAEVRLVSVRISDIIQLPEGVEDEGNTSASAGD